MHFIDDDMLVMRIMDNGHFHFRQGDAVPPFLAQKCIESGQRGRIVAEPNTDPPKLTGIEALSYAKELTSLGRAIKGGEAFEVVPVMQITEQTTPQMAMEALSCGVNIFKVYPFAVTTNSENGVKYYKKIYPVLEMIQSLSMASAGTMRGVVQFHPEDPSGEVEGLDKEESFFEKILDPIRKAFPDLKISAEHLTSEYGVEWVENQDPETTVGSITIHHLYCTLDDVIAYSTSSNGKACVHHVCKPTMKRRSDRRAIQEAAMSGNPQFLYGGDDALHLRKTSKEVAHASCGVWNTVTALPLLVQLFDRSGALNHLEDFTSKHWADFYGYPYNKGTVTLLKDPWTVPEDYPVPGTQVPGRPGIPDSAVPFWAGRELDWRVLP